MNPKTVICLLVAVVVVTAFVTRWVCRRHEYARTALKVQTLVEQLSDWCYWQASEFPQFASCAKLAAGQVFKWHQAELRQEPDAWPQLQSADSVRRDLREVFTPAPGSKTMT